MKTEKKINLLYDGLLLTAYFDKGVHRTGIFFTAYNILKELHKSNIFNITLLFYKEQKKYLPMIKKERFLSKFKYILFLNTNNNQKFNEYITINKNKLKNSKNIFSVLYSLIKIIMYNILLLLYNLFPNISLKKNNKLKKIINISNIFFSPYGIIPNEIVFNRKIRKYSMLYDIMPILFPEYYPEYFYTDDYFNEYAKMRNLNHETYFFCISECTKNDYINNFKLYLDINKLYVTYISSSQIFYKNKDINSLNYVFNKYNIIHKNNDKYIFSFCSLEPRKNLIFTMTCFIKFIKMFNINDLYFYIGGGYWESFINLLNEKINDFNEYKNKIIKLGYIDDDDVNILYSNSLFFTYISQYEGFGMPPLEAMQSGTPVITSNNSSLPEVVGDAAIMIDYNNEEQCIKAFKDLYFDESLRKSYIEKGLERAKFFSWEKTVDNISKVMINTTSL